MKLNEMFCDKNEKQKIVKCEMGEENEIGITTRKYG
jgi:hypothetical protein